MPEQLYWEDIEVGHGDYAAGQNRHHANAGQMGRGLG